MSVIDLDAARAQRKEAQGEGFDVQFGGESFTFPNVKEWPIEITETLATGDMVAALRHLLSSTDVERFLAHKPSIGDLNDLFDGLGKASGVGGLGNSLASLPS